MAEDMIVYLDGTDIKEVASAARRLDATAFYAGQMSYELFQKTMAKTDQELFDERNGYRT